MYRILFSATTVAAALSLSAQLTVHRVWVLNEGRYDYATQTQDVPVTLGAYDPATGTYQTVATLTGPRFASDIEVQDGIIYVAADDRLLKYDADTYAELAQASVPGIRRIALWNDQVLITRGEFGGLDHYFEVRDQSDLSFLYSLEPGNGPDHASEDVQVVDDRAFIAVNNGFDWPNYTGLLGVVDLTTGTYVDETDLGPDGLNPERIMLADGDVFVFNNKDFSGSSISRVQSATAALQYTQNVSLNSGCGASALVDGHIYYLEYALFQMSRFDIATGQVLDTLASTLAPYAILEDAINGVLYMTTTDFTTSGELHVTDHLGNVLASVAVGVSPGNMALDLRSSTAIASVEQPILKAYPVPAGDVVWIEGAPVGARIILVDAMGRTVLDAGHSSKQRTALDLSALSGGAYTLLLDRGTSGCLNVVKH